MQNIENKCTFCDLEETTVHLFVNVFVHFFFGMSYVPISQIKQMLEFVSTLLILFYFIITLTF